MRVTLLGARREEFDGFEDMMTLEKQRENDVLIRVFFGMSAVLVLVE